MRVNITGMLRGALRSIDPDRDTGAYAFMVEELIDHIEDVRSGKHSLEEFADFYCFAAPPLNGAIPPSPEPMEEGSALTSPSVCRGTQGQENSHADQ